MGRSLETERIRLCRTPGGHAIIGCARLSLCIVHKLFEFTNFGVRRLVSTDDLRPGLLAEAGKGEKNQRSVRRRGYGRDRHRHRRRRWRRRRPVALAMNTAVAVSVMTTGMATATKPMRSCRRPPAPAVPGSLGLVVRFALRF